MFRRIGKYFEDSKYPTLGPVVQFLKLTCLWAPSRTIVQSIIYYSFLCFVIGIWLNQLVYLIAMRRAEIIMSVVQYSPYHLGVVKIFTYHIWHKKWEMIIEELSKVETRFIRDVHCKEVFEKYKNRSRTVVFLFWSVAVSSNIIFFAKTWLNLVLEMLYDVPGPLRTRIFFIWWPFSVEERFGWAADMILQNVYAYICVMYIVAWDSLFVLMMIVFAGQMELVATKFRHSLDSGTLAKQMGNLVSCHQIYVTLLKLHKICNSILSPPLFIHLLIISLNIAISISYMTSDDPALFATALIFVTGLLFQLVLYYWPGDEITVQSKLVSYSLFESDWIDKSMQIKRLVILISMSTTKDVYISAGPFNRMSMRTFVAVLRDHGPCKGPETSDNILRASYSYYTLIKEAANK